MKLGIALGGGGIAGCTHIGVLQALEEAGIQIDFLAGTSCGAIIAALYAYGFTSSQLTELVSCISKRHLDYDYLHVVSRFITRRSKINGIIKGEKLRNFIAAQTQDVPMKDLKIPVALTATDLKKAQQVLFVSTPLQDTVDDVQVITDCKVADAVRASFSIPALFKPVTLGDKVLVDGGIFDNCPISACRALGAEKVIAVDLVFANPVQTSFDSIGAVLARAARINVAIKSKKNVNEADILLHPDKVESVGILDFRNMTSCIEYGYEYTRERMADIQKMLESHEEHKTL